MTTQLKIAILGPESTGKTTLASNLAKHYKGIWIPEYARNYIETLNRQYTYDDVVHIAIQQVKQYNEAIKNKGVLIFDTEMIITKVWFDLVFNKIPKQMNLWINELNFDMFLICFPDLPWIEDSVRENGGEKRFELFERYLSEIKELNKPYFVIKGVNQERINYAINVINNFNIEKLNTNK